MKTKLILLTSSFLFFFPTAFTVAGESGFVYQGKTFVVFKDGKKVGKTFAEEFSEHTKPAARSPSSAIPDSTTYFLSYEVDGTTRCYRWSTPGPGSTDIFCK